MTKLSKHQIEYSTLKVLKQDHNTVLDFQELFESEVKSILHPLGIRINKGGYGRKGAAPSFPIALHYLLHQFSPQEAAKDYTHTFYGV